MEDNIKILGNCINYLREERKLGFNQLAKKKWSKCKNFK